MTTDPVLHCSSTEVCVRQYFYTGKFACKFVDFVHMAAKVDFSDSYSEEADYLHVALGIKLK